MKDVIPIALLISFIWGVVPLVQKKVMKGIDHTLMMILSNIIYTTCLVMFATYNWPSIKGQVANITPNMLGWIAGIAITSSFGASLLYYHLLKHNEAYLVSTLVSLSPVFTLLVAWIALDEKISKTEMWGIALIMVGVAVLAIRG